MASPGGKSDGRHPQPEALLEFLRRHPTTLRYIERTAAWLREHYPASAAGLVPRLRELYAEQRQRGVPY